MDILPYWPGNNPERRSEQRWTRRRFLKGAGLAAGAAALLATPFITSEPRDNTSEKNEEFFYGVTLDSTENLDTTVEVLRQLPERPTTRIVFDEYMPPENYTESIARINQTGNVMGELLDSLYVKEYSLEQYKARTRDYVNAFIGQVAIWEIGNEINGEWVKNPNEPRSAVAEKVAAAHDIVKASGGQTAITLYYNEGCFADPQHEMFRWSEEVLPERIKNEVDYVFISYYEEDCNNLKPDWQSVFERLNEEFPNSKLGFGEVGTRGSTQKKADYLQRYYSIRPDVDNFVGGYFWWYFKQDMVDAYANGDKQMVKALSSAMQ